MSVNCLDENLRKRLAEDSESLDRAFSDVLRDGTPLALENVEVAADRLLRAVTRVLLEVRGAILRGTPPCAPPPPRLNT